jgi:Cd2+/Zn2+-exporting ATPase
MTQALGQVDRIAFDKTGTLTKGNFTLQNLVTTTPCLDRHNILELLSLLEASSTHPLSTALVRAAPDEGNIDIPDKTVVQDHTILQGEGLSALVDGKLVHVGNQRLFDRLGLYHDLSKDYQDLASGWLADGHSIGFMSIEGSGIVGMYSVADGIRDEAKTVVENLQKMGIQVSILTGDRQDLALSVAQQIGLLETNVHSQLLPKDKLRLLSELKDSLPPSPPKRFFGHRTGHKVMMCGDGGTCVHFVFFVCLLCESRISIYRYRLTPFLCWLYFPK